MKEVLKFVVIDVIVLGRGDISLNLDFMVKIFFINIEIKVDI